MKNTKMMLLIVAITLLSSCKKGGLVCYQEKGDLVKETRSQTNFNQVELATQGDVYFTQDDDYHIEVESSQNIIDIIKTEVRGNKLVIETKNGKCISGNPTLNFYVTAPSIKGFTISGSGNVYAADLIDADKMDLEISGSGNIDFDEIDCSDLDMHISGSGSLNINGTATMDSQEIKISGSGSVNAYNAPTNKSNVKISGSGSAFIHGIQSLDVNISGSGNVVYMGNPSVNTNVSGSGEVRPY